MTERSRAKFENDGNAKRYWLTPPDLMARLNAEFHFDFDPCPYPRPEGFDGLAVEWGSSNYVNPPFVGAGRGYGPTFWTRKCLAEHAKGKSVVMVFPVDKWLLEMLAANPEVRNLGDVPWCSVEDGEPCKGIGRHIACFILRGNGQEQQKLGA